MALNIHMYCVRPKDTTPDDVLHPWARVRLVASFGRLYVIRSQKDPDGTYWEQNKPFNQDHSAAGVEFRKAKAEIEATFPDYEVY